jgi:uncharacterized protein
VSGDHRDGRSAPLRPATGTIPPAPHAIPSAPGTLPPALHAVSRAPDTIPPALRERYADLLAHLRSRGRVLLAFSGGVDSAFLLRACVDALGGGEIRAVVGVSPSLQKGNLERARRIAASLGVCLQEARTGEFADPAYLKNASDRCFRCKHALFGLLRDLAASARGEAVLDGTNRDDLDEDRPGRRAAGVHGVESPLAELGWTKAEIRRVSRALGLETWDRPASPCLSSRIPHGVRITVKALRKVERAEAALEAMGFQEVRVRYDGASARIEVPVPRIDDLLRRREAVISSLRRAGFQEVAVDLGGYRPGGADPSSARLLPLTGSEARA